MRRAGLAVLLLGAACTHLRLAVEIDRPATAGESSPAAREPAVAAAIALPSAPLHNDLRLLAPDGVTEAVAAAFTDYVGDGDEDLPRWARGETLGSQARIAARLVATYGAAPAVGPLDVTARVSGAVRPAPAEVTTAAAVARPVLSFVQLSDAHLRDLGATLGGRRFSHLWDRIITSLERNPEQERLAPYYLAAMVDTINAAAERMPGSGARLAPSFVVHTGDAVDSGLPSELVQFHAIADRFRLPFYNVVGNHDVLAFGNLVPGACVATRTLFALSGDYPAPFDDVCLAPSAHCSDEQSCEPLLAAAPRPVARFIRLHRHDGEAGPAEPPGSRDHGFDLNHDRGYYAFSRSVDLGEGARQLRFLVLQTAAVGRGGAHGSLGRPQLDWLRGELAALGPSDLAIVLSHDPLQTLAVGGDELTRLLESSPNVIALFAGHTHRHAIRPHHTATGGFWEVETGSLMAYPLEGRLVTLKTLGGGLAFLELVSFSPSPATGLGDVARMRAAAVADACRDRLPCRRRRPIPPEPEDSNARLFFRAPGWHGPFYAGAATR